MGQEVSLDGPGGPLVKVAVVVRGASLTRESQALVYVHIGRQTTFAHSSRGWTAIAEERAGKGDRRE